MVDIWHQVSFMIVLLLAGLSALPQEPYEAARVDGASVFQSFFYITLPLMMPVIIVTLLIRMIFAVKTYDLIYIMTRGGPGVATDLVSYCDLPHRLRQPQHRRGVAPCPAILLARHPAPDRLPLSLHANAHLKAAMASITLDNVSKVYPNDVTAVRDVVARYPRRRVHDPARPLGLRKVDHAADDRRASKRSPRATC